MSLLTNSFGGRLITYVVRSGDTLTAIAQRFLGDANRWPDIVRQNKLLNPNLLYVGQSLVIPEGHEGGAGAAANSSQSKLTANLGYPLPARLALARGFLFVVFEQLPAIGALRVIRKVAVLPRDFSLAPANPSGTLSLADHVLNSNPAASPYLSASQQPFGAPSINGKPVMIDLAKVEQAGGQVYTIEEVVADLRRFAAENPQAASRVQKLIQTIEGVEGEILIRGPVQSGAVKPVTSSAHVAYVRSAEDLWRAFTEGRLTRPQLEAELATLSQAYSRARIVGNVGRGLMVIAVVLTAVDVARATNESVAQKSFKPLGAEVVRQVGGWGGAIAGGKIGFAAGALFGIETGPGAIATGAVGALIFGGLGYFGADLIADQISPN